MSLRSEVIRIFNELIGQAKKISDLPAIPSNVQNTDLFEVSRAGTSYQATGAQLPSGGSTPTLDQVMEQGSTATVDSNITVEFNDGASTSASLVLTSVESSLAWDDGTDNGGITCNSSGVNIASSKGVSFDGSFGSAGQVLQSNGPSSPPTWVPQSGIGVQDLFISAAAMWPRATGPCSDLTRTEMTTSLFNIQSLDFDQTTQEFCQFQIVLPRKWNNGTVTAVFYWTAASGSGDVQWGISGGAYSNDDALTAAFGSAQTVDDTLIATNDLHITSATSAITLSGSPADADFLAFQISRNPASDTLTGDAKLLGVSIRLTTDSAIDA